MASKQIDPFRIDWKSLLLPVVLMLTGISVLGIAAYGLVSLDRVRNLWPAAIILVGLADLFSEGSAGERSPND
jgi:hypothetical protein